MANKTTYSDKLKHPKWQKKRLEILNRDEFSCQFCADKESTLHVHHISYSPGDPWETPDRLLITLCESCHEWEEKFLKEWSEKLISELRASGFTALSMRELSWAFKDTDRNWWFPIHEFSILKMAVDDDRVWQLLSDEFYNRLRGEDK